MARPTSRYFTPVIKKLLAAKKQENIVVDPAFKASLRAELLSKVTAVPQVEKKNWMDFFQKWRYQIAFVPTALLLVVVAMQAMKLPQVTMQSQTVIPVATTETNRNDVVTPTQQKLRTFSGSAVLPSWYKRPVLTDVNGQSAYEQPVETLPSSQNVSETIPQEVSSSVQTAVPAPLNTNVQSQPVTVPVPARKIEFTVPVTPSQPVVTVPTPPVSSEKVPGIAAGDVPDTIVPPDVQTVSPAEVTAATSPDVNQSNVSADVQNTGTTAPAVTEPLPTEQTLPSQNSSALPNTSAVKTQLAPQTVTPKLPVESVPQPAYALLYQIDLSDAEKSMFETQVVAPLTQNNDVSLVSVSWAEPGVLQMDVLMKDGSTVQHLYRKNSKTKRYQEVQYVMRYSYNNDLQYSPSFGR